MHFLSSAKWVASWGLRRQLVSTKQKAEDFSFWLPCNLGVWDIWLISNPVLWPNSQEGKGSQTREKVAYFLVFWGRLHTWRQHMQYRYFLQGRNYTNVFVNEYVARLPISKYNSLGPVIRDLLFFYSLPQWSSVICIKSWHIVFHLASRE